MAAVILRRISKEADMKKRFFMLWRMAVTVVVETVAATLIKGRVKDSVSGEDITGALVKVKGNPQLGAVSGLARSGWTWKMRNVRSYARVWDSNLWSVCYIRMRVR